jgi:hypothetical protein
MYDARFFRMWEFYLAGGIVVRERRGCNYQLQYVRDRTRLPITRDYMSERDGAGRLRAQEVRETMGAAPQFPAYRPAHRREWWESPAVIAAVILLSAVPLLYPQIPPLVDLPGHMGRYRVQLDLDSSLWLGEFYGFEWAAIGNLGVDLLVVPLAPLIGLEPAVKLIVLSVPPLTVAGFLWVAREVHGRIPPTAFFAIPFAYGHPFLFGFVNYALAMALAFLAFALWLRLARLGRLRLRAALFVPISVVVFFTHTYGWGALGLMCFSAEAVRQHDKGPAGCAPGPMPHFIHP